MKTTDLLKAKPSRRPAMIVDAYAHLAARYDQLAREFKILNNWLSILPHQLASGEITMPDIDKLSANLKAFETASDEFTVQAIENADKVKRFLDAVAFFQKHDNENKTIVE